LWQDKNWVDLYSNTPAHDFEEYFSDPAVFTETIKAGADQISGRLLKSLGK
jgi:hypothetical protein